MLIPRLLIPVVCVCVCVCNYDLHDAVVINCKMYQIFNHVEFDSIIIIILALITIHT